MCGFLCIEHGNTVDLLLNLVGVELMEELVKVHKFTKLDQRLGYLQVLSGMNCRQYVWLYMVI